MSPAQFSVLMGTVYLAPHLNTLGGMVGAIAFFILAVLEFRRK